MLHFNGVRSGDSVAMKTKKPKCNHVQMSFLKTSYKMYVIIIAISIIIRQNTYLLIQLYVCICKLRDKSHPILIWYGTHYFTFKYGTILYFKELVATLTSASIFYRSFFVIRKKNKVA